MKLLVTLTVPLLATNAIGQEIQLKQIASGIIAPTDIQDPNDGSGRLFFVQQDGQVKIFRNGSVAAQPFLDIRSKTVGGGERGLLGLAFPSGFAQKQRFYVDYTDLNGDTVIAQYRVSTGNPDLANVGSEIILLHITQPFANHNGGQLRFGPDGYLYVGMGDGGNGGDPMNNGQTRSTLLGKLLRIDVEGNPGQVQIPPDNPFVNTAGVRPEIWAWGLRNPWRFTFDRVTHDLWIADVGQGAYEEVDFQPASSHGGENYGWNRMEGLHCFTPGCSPQGLVLPVAEYSHDNGACSITGGFMYRGVVSPGLRGTYIYADYCTGVISGLERQGTTWVSRTLLSPGFNITTFGEDSAGEIYVANASNGTIHHIEGSKAPRFGASAVVNSASFVPGLVPGSFATVFAAGLKDDLGTTGADSIPLPMDLGGVSVGIAGIPAPILAVANSNGTELVNFQVPFEIAGRTSAPVIVTRAGQSSAAADVPVLAVQPAVYTTDGTQAIAVHAADYTLATSSRPLQGGEFAFIYAAGLGAVSNPPATGTASPGTTLATALADVRVSIASLPCDVPFAGLAPGLVGVYQVNFHVPANPPSGSQSLILSARNASSPAVSVFVK